LNLEEFMTRLLTYISSYVYKFFQVLAFLHCSRNPSGRLFSFVLINFQAAYNQLVSGMISLWYPRSSAETIARNPPMVSRLHPLLLKHDDLHKLQFQDKNTI
jgi:hypothetical protein